MSKHIFSSLSSAIRPAAEGAASAAIGAGTAFFADKAGINLERLSETAERSRNVPLGTGAVSIRSPTTDTLAPDPAWKKYVVPVAIVAGVLVVASLLLKGK